MALAGQKVSFKAIALDMQAAGIPLPVLPESSDMALLSPLIKTCNKAANNVIVVWKKYYIETLIKELGINTTNISPNSTYIPSTNSYDEILKSHCKFIESVGLEMSEEDKNLCHACSPKC